MFKVPEWGHDIPNTNVKFAKKANSKNATKIAAPSPNRKSLKNMKTKHNTLPKKSFGNITNNNTKKPAKKRNHNNVTNKTNDDFPSNVSNVNMEIDEMLVNAKKIKLNNIYKEEDREDLLFSEKNVTKSETVGLKLARNRGTNKKSDLKPPSTNAITNDVKNPKKRKRNKNINTEMKSDDNAVKPSLKRTKLHEEHSPEVTLSENLNKDDRKKAMFKKLLEKNHRETINVSNKSDQLRDRMLERLKAAQFRYLNEKLYTSSGNEAKEIFQTDPSAFTTYHQGYQQQVKKWPVNPLDMIVQKILKMPKTFTIADMGCGEAALARRLPHTVKSFDLVAAAPGVVACDMAHTPLQAAAVDVVVYCLALMGTDLTQYLLEANRVLKQGGQLLIAEVESRFEDINAFTREVERLGFKLKSLDKQHSVFFFLHFVKTCHPPAKKAKLPALQLKPCLYKKR